MYYASSAQGTSWTAPVRIDLPGSRAYAVSLAVERESVPSRGRLYVAYQRSVGTAADVFLQTSPDGTAWSLPKRVDAAPTGASSQFPAVAVSGGRLYVAWVDYRLPTEPHVILRSSTDEGATWGPELRLSTAGLAGIQPSIDAKGTTIVVAWRELLAMSSIRAARSDDAGATWVASTIEQGDDPDDILDTPHASLDEMGTAHVVWAQTGLWEPGAVRYSWSADGTSWSTPVRVDDPASTTIPETPSIGTLAGTLWVTWTDGRTGNQDIFASWSEDGFRWGDGVRNGNDLRVDDTGRNADPGDDGTPQVNPVLFTGGYGVHVAWEDYRTGANADVYVGSVLTSPLVITEIQDAPASESRVEVYNLGNVPFDLTGVTLIAGPSRVDLGPLGSAPARAHFVVGATADSDLRATLNLPPEGGTVQIVAGPDILAVARTGFHGPAPDPLPGESVARYAGGLDYAMRWTRSPAASFGTRNSVPAPDLAPELVLNEVLYDAPNPADPFVELFYRGSGALDLAGYRLVADAEYALSSGSARTYARHPVIVRARSPTFFDGLSATGDNVYLYDPQGRLLDMVGWNGGHVAGRSLSRSQEGAGNSSAYDDVTAVRDGWAFDAIPSPQVVELGPDGNAGANPGDAIPFDLVVTNRQAFGDYLNVAVGSLPAGWSAALTFADGTPLVDSPGDADSVPDVGHVASEGSVALVATVLVPGSGDLGLGATATVVASSAARPVIRATATLQIGIRPYLVLNRTVDPTTVYALGTGFPYNEYANVTLNLTGAGLPSVSWVPQDVVFQIDVSSSMNRNDATNLRVSAVQEYIDGMVAEDRGSVIGFHDIAWVVNDRPLTNATPGGKFDLKGDAGSLACSPYCLYETNIDNALELGNSWLIMYGNPSRPRVEILLTDGICAPPCTRTPNLVAQAKGEGIVIYTIGLGSEVEESYLRGIAEPTGGAYYPAASAKDLLEIYRTIGERVDRTAAVDLDPGDDVPMIEDVLPPYLAVDPNGYRDPFTGASKRPDYMRTFPDRTILQWNVSSIDINETWAVQYRVRSYWTGLVDVSVFPDARVQYIRWDGSSVTQPLPTGTLNVLQAPNAPFITDTQPPNGAVSVPLSLPIGISFSEAMNPASVQWTVSPPVAATPWWPQPNILFLNHTGFQPCTTYTARITAARDVQGENLRPAAKPNPWSFRTVCATPFIRSTSPVADEADVLLAADVVVTFSGPMDPATVSWSLSPATPTVGAWSAGNAVLTIQHATPFAPCTGYSVLVSGSDPFGQPLGAGPVPNPWPFTTVCPTVRYVVSRTPEWGFVFVDEQPYPAPAEFFWRPGEVHRISAPDLDPYGTSRLAFSRWDDGGLRDHVIVVPSQDDAVIAEYLLQHPVDLRLEGLDPGHPGTVRSAAFGITAEIAAHDSWSSWVDDQTPVQVDDPLPLADERWVTKDPKAWVVSGPLAADVRYVHQFAASVRVTGLGGRPVGITFQSWGEPLAVPASATWSGWVDADSDVATESMIQIGGRERYRTLDPTQWTATGPLDETVTFVHQFRPFVRLEGTDADHTVSVRWRVDRVPLHAAGLAVEWTEWTDAGTTVAFDAQTSGAPPRYAIDPVSLPIATAIDAVIRYAGQGAPPPVVIIPPNWKPVVALVYGLILLLAAFATARAIHLLERRNRNYRRELTVLAAPVGLEGAIGILSLVTGWFRIPDGGEWLCLGFWVNTAILIGGLVADLTLWKRGARRPPL